MVTRTEVENIEVFVVVFFGGICFFLMGRNYIISFVIVINKREVVIREDFRKFFFLRKSRKGKVLSFKFLVIFFFVFWF